MFERFLATLDDMQSVVLVLWKMVEEVITEPGQIAGNSWNAAGHAFQRGIAPGFIITRKYSQVASPYKLVILHSKERVGAVDEIGVIDHLHFVIRVVQHVSCF